MAEALRFGRSLVVGSWGSALDFGALTFSLRVLHLDASLARVVGLVLGAVVLFYGSRSFAFRTESESAAAQARRFVASELVGFPLNLVVFKAALWLLPSVLPEALSLLANFVLFVSYYYPVRRHLVFRLATPNSIS
jgi:putative flippase GtrA